MGYCGAQTSDGELGLGWLVPQQKAEPAYEGQPLDHAHEDCVRPFGGGYEESLSNMQERGAYHPRMQMAADWEYCSGIVCDGCVLNSSD